MLHTLNVIGCFEEIKASKFDKMGKFEGSPNLLHLSASLENKRWLRFCRLQWSIRHGSG